MRRALRSTLKGGLVALLLLQLTACGTILYPERRGTADGRLDAGVVVLDAVGLLFFLVPGVIAFAVDFSTGAIYLPHGRRSDLEEIIGGAEIGEHGLDRRELGDILALVERDTGLQIDSRALRVLPAQRDEAVETRLRELNAQIAVTRSGDRRAGG